MNGKLRLFVSLIATSALLALAGCGGVLPSKRSETESPWVNFDQAKASYDLIVPGETRMLELEAMGFDPYRTPNMRRLNHLELIQVFMPHQSVQRSDLDPLLRECLDARESCYAFAVQPGVSLENRQGNVALDLLGFRRETQTTGWQFSSLIVLKDDTVAYKVWSGEPNIQREETERKPLGPLQNSGEKLISEAL